MAAVLAPVQRGGWGRIHNNSTIFFTRFTSSLFSFKCQYLYNLELHRESELDIQSIGKSASTLALNLEYPASLDSKSVIGNLSRKI